MSTTSGVRCAIGLSASAPREAPPTTEMPCSWSRAPISSRIHRFVDDQAPKGMQFHNGRNPTAAHWG
jgi:hypothetical protein